MSSDGPLGCTCHGSMLSVLFRYEEPPEGEVRFELGPGAYRREILRCQACGHCVSRHDMDMDALYRGQYVDATYGVSGLAASFDRIMALPPDRSDNVGRVRRLVAFGQRWFEPAERVPGLLDVGSGLGVFPVAIAREGWQCVALDPDPRAVAHCASRGVETLCADFLELDPREVGEFDVVTFNKVLEHVEDPVIMLTKALDVIASSGFVYVEVPYASLAAVDGSHREEFFIDHHHVFTPASMSMLAERSGFSVLEMEALREPSSKWTIRAFLRPHPSRSKTR